jgi:hypothetical protein
MVSGRGDDYRLPILPLERIECSIGPRDRVILARVDLTDTPGAVLCMTDDRADAERAFQSAVQHDL